MALASWCGGHVRRSSGAELVGVVEVVGEEAAPAAAGPVGAAEVLDGEADGGPPGRSGVDDRDEDVVAELAAGDTHGGGDRRCGV